MASKKKNFAAPDALWISKKKNLIDIGQWKKITTKDQFSFLIGLDIYFLLEFFWGEE